MIRNKADYHAHLAADYALTGLPPVSLKNHLIDKRYAFYRGLRRAEYYTNCRKDFAGRVLGKAYRLIHQRRCIKTGWTIPLNVFDSGLAIVHVGTVVVSAHAKVGKNCRIHVCVNIGRAPAKNEDGAPRIGDNCYIGPGAVIFGPLHLGDNVAIGANAVVNSSFPEGNCTIAGVPARKISNKTSACYIGIRSVVP